MLWLRLTGVEKWDIYNIPNWNPEDVLKSGAHITVFGEVAKNLVSRVLTEREYLPLSFTILPSLNALRSLPENYNTRYETYRRLKEEVAPLPEIIDIPLLRDSEIRLSYMSIEEMPAQVFIELLGKKTNLPRAIRCKKGGYIIGISIDDSNIEGTDITITPSELLVLYLLKKTLDIEEIELRERK